VEGDDAAKDNVAASGALADADDAIQSALEGDRGTGDVGRADVGRRAWGDVEPLELALAVGKGGSGVIHGAAESGWDEVDDELARFLDVAKRVLGAAEAVVDGAEEEGGWLGADAHEEAERREVRASLRVERRNPGDGAREDRVDHPLVHVADGEGLGIEMHGCG